MASKLLPAESFFALLLNLSVIAVASASLARLTPRSLQISAQYHLINQQVTLSQQRVSELQRKLAHDKSQPNRNLKENANLSEPNSLHIFWNKD